MEDFCGSELWNLNKTWYTDNPDLTPCFEKTVLVWVPCGFLWLTAAFDIAYSLKSSLKRIPLTLLNFLKISGTAILLLLEILYFSYSFRHNSHETFKIEPVDRYTPVIKGLTFLLALVLLLLNKNKGIRSSGIQFMFWFIFAICGAFQYQTSWRNVPHDGSSDHEKFWFYLIQISYPLILGQFILHFFTDGEFVAKKKNKLDTSETNWLAKSKEKQGKTKSFGARPCPEASASFPSRLTYQWLWGLTWLGYKKPLVFDDLWDLNEGDKSKPVVQHFFKFWKPKLAEAQKQNAGQKDGKVKASILPALCKSNWDIFLFGSFLKLLQDLLTFVSPEILDLLIDHVSSDQETWKGYFYGVLLFIVSMTQTFLLGQYFQRMFVVGMRIKSSLVGAIYEKSLVISNAARKEKTVGEIVNLMSVDSQRFVDLTTYVNMLWSAPLQISLSLYFLYAQLGPAVFAGVGVMVCLIPINTFLANKVKGLQIQQMKNKDQRVKLMNEILSGVKVLKFYAWELKFEEQVNAIRSRELKVLRTMAYLGSFTTFLWYTAPFLVSLVSFATYVLIDSDNVLDSKKAFVSLTLFNIMRMPMTILPSIIVYLVEAGVSLKRLNEFMNAEEIDPSAVTHEQQSNGDVISVQGSFRWDETPVLKDITLNIKEKSLVAVVGTVGSGKSSLLSAILGEMERIKGRVNTVGSIAYVAQQAWIQNATLKDNILFGKDLKDRTYNKVIEACALGPDLAILPAGDKTEIGEKGINLSGGQKQRVSLARAVYNNADLYLFDDPLSAVDSHVGKHIFDNVIGPKGILKNKTRLLITHGVTYLPFVDYIVVMTDGQISETGTFDHLLKKKGAFADFLIQHAEGMEGMEGVHGDQVDENTLKTALTRELSRLSESVDVDPADFTRRMSTWSLSSQKSAKAAEENYLLRRASRQQDILRQSISKVAQEDKNKDRLIEAEGVETGSVKKDVYTHYMKSVGWPTAIWTFFFYVSCNGLSMYSNIWLSQWSTDTDKSTKTRDTYLGVYGALGFGQALTVFLATLIMSIGCLRAAKFLHGQMLSHILRCPTSFFDTTPLGRIVNRFSKDVDVADNTFPLNLRQWLTCLFQVLATFIVISYSTPFFLVVIIPIGVIYYLVQRFYVATSRQLKRLESVSRSPIYSHFSETLSGSMTIRAYAMQGQFIRESERMVDHNQIAYYPSIIANRWLAIRLETVGNFVIFFAALFAILDKSNAGAVGLSVSYALSVTQVLNWLVRMTSDVETNVVAVERIKEYGEVVQEAEWDMPDRKPPPSWPSSGVVEFDHYQTRYREGLDLVLRNVTCKIEAGEKIGIVGRTGAGKSSLTLALFRIVEPAGGSIIIDGQNIAKMGLHDLRSKLTIIPQDPVLFSGTLRFNLDPFEKYSDDELWRALELSHLKTFTQSLPAKLDHVISEGGENLSVGQRQLVCLGRALLRKTTILILDEATAAVDLETDDLIQNTIRSEFTNCTTIVIAHRLNTIMDSTRVIVLDKGEIVEFDTPANLLEDSSSIFHSMAADAGLVDTTKVNEKINQ